MNSKDDSADMMVELGQLASALCEGLITPEEARRLEEIAGASDRARRFLVRYIQLHGELYWDSALSARADALAGVESALEAPTSEIPPLAAAELPSKTGRPVRSHFLRLAGLAAVAAILVVISALAVFRGGQQGPLPAVAPPAVARLTGVAEARWSAGLSPITVGSDLPAGHKVQLLQGLAEITFGSGAQVLLEGPATLKLTSTREGFLSTGKLAAKVPAPAAGFTIHTPTATIVDLGTEFGLAVYPNRTSEVHVFSGTVEVYPGTVPRSANTPHKFQAGQAAAISFTANGDLAVDRIGLRSDRFTRTLDARESTVASVARFRSLVARHPRLIHHYTFEGTSRVEKMLDLSGDLDLNEAVMLGGRGRVKIDYTARGIDPTSEAVAFSRVETSGNTRGIGLQSDIGFHPGEDLSVELLLKFDRPADLQQEGFLAAAVATRSDQDDCGFFVVVVRGGQLAHLMDRNADWVETGVKLVSGEWYYVAATFGARAGSTTINTYVARLSDEQPALRQVVCEQVTPGVPAASRLGIGKAFDGLTAHAYPWSGAIDEVALYDAVLDTATLRTHLEALVGGSSPPVR